MSTKSHEPIEKKKTSGFTKGIVWVLMAMLVLGLGGFGVTNFGGSVQSIGSVGDEEIGADEYARTLQQELRAMSRQMGQNVTLEQANQLSLTLYGRSTSDRVLARLYTTAALDNETADLGLSVGDEEVRERLLQVPAFQGLDGNFDRESYRFALRQAGMNEREFEQSLRKDVARTLLQGAVVDGVAAPETAVETILDYAAERRDFTWTKLTRDDLAEPLPEPTEAELTEFYEANPDLFTAPETKRITYALLSPDALLDTIEVDEDALRAIYDERIEEYQRPERRLVERLVFEDDAAAQAAHAQLMNEETTFDALVSERGLSLSDVDLGDVTREELGEAADAVFSLEAPGDYTAPQPSSLGPAIYRMNGILNAQVTSFEEARDELKEEYALDRARRIIEDSASGIDDMLAAGATLEEVTADTDMTLGQIDWTRGSDEGIAAYEGFRQAARAVTLDDFPEVLQLEDGSLFSLRLDEVVPPTLRPLDDVREDVIAGWEQTAVEARLEEQAEALITEIGNGQEFVELGLTARRESAITRNAFFEEAPRSLAEAVFARDEGEVGSLTGAGEVIIFQVDAVLPPDFDDPDTVQLQAQLRESFAQGISADLFEAFARALQAEAGITRDPVALNAIHTQFP